MTISHVATSQSLGLALWGATGLGPIAAAKPDWGGGRALRLGHTLEVATRKNAFGKLPLRKYPSGKYLTSKGVRYIQ